MSEITMRERILSIVEGRRPDRVPFVKYRGLVAPNDEVWSVLGRDNIGLLQWLNLYSYETPHCSWESETFEHDGAPCFRQTLHTPEGLLVQEGSIQPTYGIWVPVRRFIREPEDYHRLLAWFRDIKIHLNLEGYRQALRELGEDGLPHTSVPRTPYQQLWIQWVDIQDLAVHMVDYPELMEEVIAVMTDVQRRVYEQICTVIKNDEIQIPYLVVPDNITAPMIGPAYFRKFCLPGYDELAARLEETGRDIPVYVHMDGDLKLLWDLISESRVRGLDSMSPPPDNDTTVAEAVTRWPEMRVGINFPSSLHLAKPEEVYNKTIEILQEGAPSGRLQIQISENVPPDAWRTSFPAIVKAIRDYSG